MDRRVDPTTALTQQNCQSMRNNRPANRFLDEAQLHHMELIQHQRGEHTIFSELVQVSFVKRMDIVSTVPLVDIVTAEQRLLIFRIESVHCEAPRKACDTPKYTLERLFHVMGTVIFEDLYHGDQTLIPVVNLSLTTASEDGLVVVHLVDEVLNGKEQERVRL